MKTTVKDFILENMTDVNFEKLVNNFMTNSIFDGDPEDSLMDKVKEHLEELSIKSEDESFETLKQIKEMSSYYIANYKEQFLPRGISDLNDTTSTWKMKIFDRNKEQELEIENDIYPIGVSGGVKDLKYFFASYPQLKSEPGNFFFDELKYPFTFSISHNRPLLVDSIESVNVDENNYIDYIEGEKRPLALGLTNFLYEVLHYNTESKNESPQFEGFSLEKSHVKIVKEDSRPFDYTIHFLLDNRTQYISEGTHKAYSKQFDNDKLTSIPSKFIDFECLYEDLSTWDIKSDYILEPFTRYLNEELIIPELSEGSLYNVLEQLVTLLTLQGFTKSEQIQAIIDENKNYEDNIKYIYML